MRYPVSFAQRRLWALDRLVPGDPASHLSHATWLDGPVDPVALQRAMDAVVALHATLRTSVVTVDGVPEQVVDDTGGVLVDHVVLPRGPEDVERAESIAAELAVRPFDLERGPLLRAALVEAGTDRWLFVLVAHRIVVDDTALTILLDDLSTVYRDGTAALSQPWMDYGDYAVWQRERLRGEELARQLDHWREVLRDVPEKLALPTDAHRPTRSSRGARATAAIDTTSTRRLADVAQGLGATLSAVFLTGYAVVLSRYARQADLVIGLPVSGRIRAELEPIAGPFADTVPVRVSLAGAPTFAELLDRVRDATAEALSHDELPLDKLTEELGIDFSGHAVRFASQPPAAPVPDFPGVAVRSRVVFTPTAEVDLDLTASDDGAVTLGYRADLFGAPFADRFLRSVVTVLEHAGQAPHTPVADLPLLPAEEIVVPTSARPVPPDEFDLLRLLSESTAVVTDGSGTVPVSVVCDRAARLARTISERGIGQDTRTGVCLDRGVGLLTALLGVWWAGSAIVPLEPDLPLSRLGIMARDAALALVVSDDDHAGLARSVAGDVPVITLGEAATEPLDRVPALADALAYTVFTSGPADGPTGVDITHGALANLLAVLRRDLGLGADDRFAAVTTTSSDVALLELLLPLVCGADLVIAAAADTREAGPLRSLVERSAVTAVHATPHTWRLLLSGGSVPASLRLRLCGGDLPRDLANSLTAPDAVLWRLYGHAETAVWSAVGEVVAGEGPVVIGPAVGHTRVHVLDERLAKVPVGVVGEIHIAGVGVARGYPGRPEHTSAAFRPEPWATGSGARMYATGDLGRWREDGGLELVGRTDHRVVVRGVRVDCGEVEAALRAHHAVREAVVVSTRKDGEPVLVAYVVPDPDGPAARVGTDLLALIRPHLRAILPEPVVPALVVALPALPTTRDGGVDRAALPAPEWATRPSVDRVPPRDPVEETMARIWAELLRTTEPIGVHDNLFGLGGGSLTAVRFAARIADTYGVNLPMHRIVVAPTIAALAEIVSADLGSARADENTHADETAHAAETTRDVEAARDAELVGLSDDELDDLLRAVLATRDRRRTAKGDAQ
ncbi:non-ribosomal peptide synthetase [Saccharothrix deserti]|uniref:non-ribosomal peptide synthetase n=1 Tax=Saccharothrix deserti TaxID=2593674 RepID=UPI00131E6923|nr:condensation domain-containing protein [Saccharothrix deserti]